MILTLVPQALFVLLVCTQRGISILRLQLYFVVFLLFYVFDALLLLGNAFFQGGEIPAGVEFSFSNYTLAALLMGLNYMAVPNLIFSLTFALNGNSFPSKAWVRVLIGSAALLAPSVLIILFGDWVDVIIRDLLGLDPL